MFRFKNAGDNRVGAVKEFAVIGLGRFGSSLAAGLMKAGHTVLGIDSDPALVQRYSNLMSQTLSLDSTDVEALKEVDIPSYETVIIAIGSSFEAAVLTTVALKQLNVPNVLVKATNTVHRDILLKVGADRVVLPEYEAGERLADELTTPDLVGQIILCEKTRVSELRVPRHMVGKSLAEVELRERHGVTVVAIQRGDESLVNPAASTRLQTTDLMVVIGSAEDISHLSHEE